MLAALVITAISSAIVIGLLLIVVGAVLLAIDLGEHVPDEARAAVGSGAVALGLVLLIAGASPLCRWVVLA